MSDGLALVPGEKSSSRLFRICRIGLAVLLAGAIAWFVDLGAAYALLQQTDWRWLMVALLLVQVQIMLSAWRWQITAVRLGQSLSVPTAIREYYLASAVNMSLPGGITGDAARVVRARHGSTLSLAAQGVVLERLAGQIALFVITLIGWLLWPLLMDGDAPGIGVRMIGVILGVLICLVLIKVMLAHFARNRVSRFVISFGPAMHQAWIADRQWCVQIALNIVIVVSYLLVFALCSYALGELLPNVALIVSCHWYCLVWFCRCPWVDGVSVRPRRRLCGRWQDCQPSRALPVVFSMVLCLWWVACRVCYSLPWNANDVFDGNGLSYVLFAYNH